MKYVSFLIACPVIDKLAAAKEKKKKKNPLCPDTCVSQSECASEELCCPNACGGNTCYNPRLASKYRSEDQKLAATKCKDADRFVLCLYNEMRLLQRCLN